MDTRYHARSHDCGAHRSPVTFLDVHSLVLRQLSWSHTTLFKHTRNETLVFNELINLLGELTHSQATPSFLLHRRIIASAHVHTCIYVLLCTHIPTTPTWTYAHWIPIPLQYFPDRFVRREILSLPIVCSSRDRGCNWEGQFSELEVGDAGHKCTWYCA